MIKIIGISGIGGAGKSTLTHRLGEALKATILFWDDFDEISEEPSDFIQWYQQGRDYSVWKYDALATVLKKLKEGKSVISPVTKTDLVPTEYIIFDAPLGRNHTATGQYIDFTIFLNTPLDIALARRLLRDFRDNPNPSCDPILEELDFYLTSSRPLYTMAYEDLGLYDLVLDGSLSIDKLLSIVIDKLSNFDFIASSETMVEKND